MLHMLHMLPCSGASAGQWLVFDAKPQPVRGLWVAMGDEHAVWRRRQAAQPGHELVAVGVGAGRGELYQLGAHGDVVPMDAQRCGTGGQRGAAGAWPLGSR